jgi:hypothetical protein
MMAQVNKNRFVYHIGRRELEGSYLVAQISKKDGELFINCRKGMSG